MVVKEALLRRRRPLRGADLSRITLRIGVNLGDVIIEGDDIYGDGVNVAARLEGLAEPGEVFISGNGGIFVLIFQRSEPLAPASVGAFLLGCR